MDDAEPGQIVMSRVRGRGVTVDEAPQRALIAVQMLAASADVYVRVINDVIEIADQVAYRITGYDPQQAALTVTLVKDWRKEDGDG